MQLPTSFDILSEWWLKKRWRSRFKLCHSLFFFICFTYYRDGRITKLSYFLPQGKNLWKFLKGNTRRLSPLNMAAGIFVGNYYFTLYSYCCPLFVLCIFFCWPPLGFSVTYSNLDLSRQCVCAARFCAVFVFGAFENWISNENNNDYT